MSLDQQVALARPSRGESTHLSKAARQVVPPFLQKLYEIVNDPRNEELIRWSENGDSFYVLNHEKFAREVLGRWFKHQKFASFVRQLNMYGFHKIPHLQQGVLKSETDTEPWHFEHPHFHQGQPDLLCLIQRKKQPVHGVVDDLDIHEAVNAAAPLATLSPGQVMDINSVVNGIAAIKRHQQAISADLSALKQSNDALWKEAVLARERHAKHQDTINRILKFLAGVFGHTAEPVEKANDSRSPPHAVIPRVRQQRLLIGDGRTGKGKPVGDEVYDDENGQLRPNATNGRSTTPFSVDQYTSIETPESSITSPPTLGPEVFSPMSEPLPEISTQQSCDNKWINQYWWCTADQWRCCCAPAANTSLTTTQGQSSDAVWQAAVQHMMNSPEHIPTTIPEASSQIASYDPAQYPYLPSPPSASHSSLPLLSSTAHADNSPMLQPLLENVDQLQKTYRDASEIDADMDVLQHNINSLIQNLGIDPSTIMTTVEDHPNFSQDTTNPIGLHPDSSLLSDIDMHHADTTSDYHLLDSLLNEITEQQENANFDYTDVTDRFDPSAQIDGHGTRLGDASTEQLTAFLDDASSDTTSPKTNPLELHPARQKRKSDLVDLPSLMLNHIDASSTGPKAKRKR
ncbi:Heat shock factor protein [Grifola frondosa]|uniref:Heat shock factor protein n=1 Tax=Grifola frondosa TaxID=5627 RepID=A0A1C7LLM9_GRIFR|nr:Heat shock factor protein [Grifola frondosa]